MRYVVSSILLMAALFVFCCVATANISVCVGRCEDALLRAEELHTLGETQGVIQAIDEANDIWKRQETFLGSVLRHDSIDQVITEFARLKSYAKTEDCDDFLSNCAALLAQLEHIREMEQPYFRNVM